MKKTCIFVFLFFVCLSGKCFSASDWRDVTNNLAGGEFYSIKEGPAGNFLYVGTSYGLYKVGERRKEWEGVFLCKGKDKGVYGICLSGKNEIYIGTGSGLYKSVDRAASWRRIFKIREPGNRCTSVEFLPHKNRIYLGTLKGLFWTEDGGKAWHRKTGIMGNCEIKSITTDIRQGSSSIFIICGNGLYKTGESTTGYEKIFGFRYGEENSSDDESEDTGDYAESESTFLLNEVIFKNGILYLCTSKGLYISDSSGETWRRFNDAGLTKAEVKCVYPEKKIGCIGSIFAAAEKGVFIYREGKYAWEEIDTGMDSWNIKKLLADASHDYIYVLCKNKIYKMNIRDLEDVAGDLPNKDISSVFGHEPTVDEVRTMALAYAEVQPDKIERWRRQAKLKAILPKVVIGVDCSRSDTYEIYTSSSQSYWLYGPRDKTEGWDLSLSWD
ncbi:MAG: hypothetical protein JW994_00425, partial [Candidatus Omnitrophica bacterium]|nr:hypothetical protein [Candidatus Omnitrophota bacterium]